jgi:hypothetical protein
LRGSAPAPRTPDRSTVYRIEFHAVDPGDRAARRRALADRRTGEGP